MRHDCFIACFVSFSAQQTQYCSLRDPVCPHLFKCFLILSRHWIDCQHVRARLANNALFVSVCKGHGGRLSNAKPNAKETTANARHADGWIYFYYFFLAVFFANLSNSTSVAFASKPNAASWGLSARIATGTTALSPATSIIFQSNPPTVEAANPAPKKLRPYEASIAFCFFVSVIFLPLWTCNAHD